MSATHYTWRCMEEHDEGEECEGVMVAIGPNGLHMIPIFDDEFEANYAIDQLMRSDSAPENRPAVVQMDIGDVDEDI